MVNLSRFLRDSASSCAAAAVFACASFQQKRPSPGGKSPGLNAFVPASIHNIGFCVKVIVNDIQFQTAKKGTKNIFSILPVDTTSKFAQFRRISCNIFGLTSDTLRCILSAYYFKRQRRRGNTAVSLPLFISQPHKIGRKGSKTVFRSELRLRRLKRICIRRIGYRKGYRRRNNHEYGFRSIRQQGV